MVEERQEKPRELLFSLGTVLEPYLLGGIAYYGHLLFWCIACRVELRQDMENGYGCVSL